MKGSASAPACRVALPQDYANLSVIAIDDRSTDNTGAVMDELAAADEKLRVLHITEAPAAGLDGQEQRPRQGQQARRPASGCCWSIPT